MMLASYWIVYIFAIAVLVLLICTTGCSSSEKEPVLNGPVVQEWATYYNAADLDDEAHAITVDSSGYIYVTGESALPSDVDGDYATVKYDSNGNELWVARYDGPAGTYDEAYAIVVDEAGNVYVTGSSSVTGILDDYATVKYDSNGNELWVAHYDSPAGEQDHASAITLDNFGNVYVTGASRDGGHSWDQDYATVKYDSNGNEVWAVRYKGPGADYDVAHAIAVDQALNVYVTGVSHGGGSSHDYATIKYDSEGNELWIARYDGLANSQDEATDLALDAAGNVYVTGFSTGSGTDYDYTTIKYDINGNEVWVARYDGTANAYDRAYDLALDAAGNVYVTGLSYIHGNDSAPDYATIKYDSNGNEVWISCYDGPAGYIDGATAIALDGSGNVYVTGLSYAGDSGEDYATIKYNCDGKEVWVARYNGPDYSFDSPTGLALDDAGSVYVTGSVSEDASSDYATIKYTQ